MTNCSIYEFLSAAGYPKQEIAPHLLELVNSENTPSILSVGSRLTTIARTKTCISNRELLLLQPFIGMKSGNRLLGGSNQVLVVLLLSIYNLF